MQWARTFFEFIQISILVLSLIQSQNSHLVVILSVRGEAKILHGLLIRLQVDINFPNQYTRVRALKSNNKVKLI